MDYEFGLNCVNSEINELLCGSDDTFYFDNDDNVFKVNYGGFEVGLTWDRLIDIL